MTALIHATAGAVPARVDYGRWLADCYWCNGAGLVRIGAPVFTCPCGAVWDVVWPSEDMLRGIHRLLLMRPPENRWWAPGDTLSLLMWENAEHGLFDNLPEITGSIFTVADDRILVDNLPALTSTSMKAVTG
jgi:hypothetical protein